MRGTLTIIDKGDVRVHSYMAPDDGLNVTTQLIEVPILRDQMAARGDLQDRAGVPVNDVTMQRASLDDVFLSLTGHVTAPAEDTSDDEEGSEAA